MSQDNTAQQKADQIAHRFFAKFVLVIDGARNVLSDQREDAKADKWVSVSAMLLPPYRKRVSFAGTFVRAGISRRVG